MTAKFGIVENTTTEASQLFAGDYNALAIKTIKAGEGAAIKRGTVMCRGIDDKYYILDLFAADVAGEVLAAGTGALKQFFGQLAANDIVPGSVTIHATIGAAAKTATDDSRGRLSGDAGNITGFIDYKTGHYSLTFATAPDNATNVTGDYTPGGANAVASAILASAEAVDATADLKVPMVLAGKVRLSDLVWPDDITAGQKTLAIQHLREAGVIVE